MGSERALLFDTGPGVRDISPVARSLTSLPIEVLPSHLHFDHTGNLHRFDDVSLPDMPALRAQVHDGLFSLGLYQSLGFVEGFERVPFRVAHWLEDGSEIDLGARHLQLVGVPGHTPESVVLFDRAADRVYAGDFIYPSEIYAFLPGANLSDYAASARRVEAMVDDDTQNPGRPWLRPSAPGGRAGVDPLRCAGPGGCAEARGGCRGSARQRLVSENYSGERADDVEGDVPVDGASHIRCAAVMVLASSMVTVIGPTPPGTGVM